MAALQCCLRLRSKAKLDNFANLISKLNFYKLIPYPMNNCFTGWRVDKLQKRLSVENTSAHSTRQTKKML